MRALALVISQAALLFAEIEKMKVANAERAQNGQGMLYGAHEFESVIEQYQGTLGYNAVTDALLREEL